MVEVIVVDKNIIKIHNINNNVITESDQFNNKGGFKSKIEDRLENIFKNNNRG